jgi:chromosome segregation ATPase
MSIKKWIANIVNLEVDQSDTARELKKLGGALDMAYHRIHKLEERADAFHRRAEDLEVADSAVMIVRASSRISRLEDRTDDALTQLSRHHDSLIGMRNSHTADMEDLQTRQRVADEEIEDVKVSFNNLDIPKAEDIIGDDEVEEWIKNAVVTAVEDLEISVAVC